MRLRFFVLCFTLTVAEVPAYAQEAQQPAGKTKSARGPSSCRYFSTPNVEIDSKYYQYIDKLVGADLVAAPVYSQRPWSRREFARMAIEARKVWPVVQYRSFASYIGAVLVKLEAAFKDEILAIQRQCDGIYERNNVLTPREVSVAYRYLDSAPRDTANSANFVNDDRGSRVIFGGIESRYEPLGEHRGGRKTEPGHEFAMESEHRQVFGSYASVFARPRIGAYRSRGEGPEAVPDFQKAYAKLAYQNIEFEVGRDELIWGQGERGGFLFTDNARPISMMKLTSSSAFRVPIVSRVTGPMKFTYFHGTLGSKGALQKTAFYGAQMSFFPASWLELAAGQALIFGSSPGNKASSADYVSEFFLKRRDTVGGNGHDVADRNNAGSFRIYVPSWRQTQFYGELLLNVGRGSIMDSIKKLASFSGGMYIPVLGDEGRYSLRLDWVKGNPDSYRHGHFVEGYTYNKRILGNPVGPQSDRYTLKLSESVSETHDVDVSVNYDISSGDQYVNPLGDDAYLGDMYVFRAAAAKETRVRLDVVNSFAIDERSNITVDLGIERVYHFNFQPDKTRNNVLTALAYKKAF